MLVDDPVPTTKRVRHVRRTRLRPSAICYLVGIPLLVGYQMGTLAATTPIRPPLRVPVHAAGLESRAQRFDVAPELPAVGGAPAQVGTPEYRSKLARMGLTVGDVERFRSMMVRP